MTIHHDKLGYGKLVSSREDVSEERLLEMARLLSEKDDRAESEEERKPFFAKKDPETGE